MKFSLGDKVYILTTMDGNPFISPYPLEVVAYACRDKRTTYSCKYIAYHVGAVWIETEAEEKNLSKTREVLEERVAKIKKAR